MTTSARRAIFLLNPASAAGSTRERFERVRSRFAARVEIVDVKLTEGVGHASTLARALTSKDCDVVVSVGGDGTLNEVVQGLVDDTGHRRDDAPMLAVFPSGTGGDFRRTFWWSDNPADTLARITHGTPRAIDAGWLTCRYKNGADTSRAFINVSSFGLSGAVDDVVNRSSKALGGKASFLLGTIRAVTGYRAPRVKVSIDGGPAREQTISLCVLGNGQFFGGGMWIAPGAAIDDGEFEGVTFGDLSLAWWITKGPKVYKGRHLEMKGVERFACRRLDAEPLEDRPVFIDLDGELPGMLPARWEIRPKAITVLG